MMMARIYTHPGEVLREELMVPSGLTADGLAAVLGVGPKRIRELVDEMLPMSRDIALRLERFFGISATFWLNLQAAYDLSVISAAHGDVCEQHNGP